MMKTKWITRFAAVLMALVLGLLSQLSTMAQTDNASSFLKLYTLKYTDAGTVVNILGTVVESGSIQNMSADGSNNRVIVNASQGAHDEVQKLIEKLDQPPADDEEVKLLPSSMVETAVLRSLFAEVDIAMAGDQLVLKGSSQDVERASAIISEIQKNQNKAAAGEMKDLVIEVQWLTEDSIPEGFVMKGPLADKLKARGFGELFVFATIENRVRPDGVFECLSDQGRTTLKASGQVQSTEVGLNVDLAVSVAHEPVALEFESSFAAQPGAWLVFGVAQGSDAEVGNLARSLILVRVKEDLPLN